MSSRYAFTKTVKELRFLFCQTSDHSNTIRQVFPSTLPEATHSFEAAYVAIVM